MAHHTKDKGDLGVAKAHADLVSQGYVVLFPATEHAPFDLVAYRAGVFERVQVKYRSASSGRVQVALRSSWADRHGTHDRPVDKAQVDVLCVYCPETDECYYVRPASHGSSISLRVTPARNNQAVGVAVAGLFRRARSATAALQAVRDRGKVRAGQDVLVIGAGGGVGLFAVQIAKAFGGQATGVCSGAQAELVRANGAAHVIDYTRQDFADGPKRYDVILDIAGNSTLSHLRRALAPRGTLVIVGGETDGRWIGGFDRQLRAPVMSLLVSQHLGLLASKENADDLVVLRGLIESGKLAPVVDRTYPLNETVAAIRHLTDGHVQGKVVIAV